jgi:hypothetical protein
VLALPSQEICCCRTPARWLASARRAATFYLGAHFVDTRDNSHASRGRLNTRQLQACPLTCRTTAKHSGASSFAHGSSRSILLFDLSNFGPTTQRPATLLVPARAAATNVSLQACLTLEALAQHNAAYTPHLRAAYDRRSARPYREVAPPVYTGSNARCAPLGISRMITSFGLTSPPLMTIAITPALRTR